jgi:ABC-type transporter Mla subunit MlaD
MTSSKPLNDAAPPVTSQSRDAALLALFVGLLPVWGRHMASARSESETAVGQMLKAFADIGPHIDMAERQSEQINDALAQPIDGIVGLVGACEHLLAPLVNDPMLKPEHKAAIHSVKSLVGRAVGALEQISKPFQHETQMVAEQVDRMYMGFQYQDRISQMLGLVEGDLQKLQAVLENQNGAVPELAHWLQQLESRYAMSEQHRDHAGTQDQLAPPDSNETTFF